MSRNAFDNEVDLGDLKKGHFFSLEELDADIQQTLNNLPPESRMVLEDRSRRGKASVSLPLICGRTFEEWGVVDQRNFLENVLNARLNFLLAFEGLAVAAYASLLRVDDSHFLRIVVLTFALVVCSKMYKYIHRIMLQVVVLDRLMRAFPGESTFLLKAIMTRITRRHEKGEVKELTDKEHQDIYGKSVMTSLAHSIPSIGIMLFGFLVLYEIVRWLFVLFPEWRFYA